MDLIAAVNKKDYKLFGAFFRENFPFLVMFADKYVNDMDMAADIAQEAFIQLWRFEGEFVSPEKVKGFLYTTARNLALNHIKHNQIVDEHLTYIIHSGFISGYQNRYGDNLKPPTNVYHRMTA